jgi:hypothetical protein
MPRPSPSRPRWGLKGLDLGWEGAATGHCTIPPPSGGVLATLSPGATTLARRRRRWNNLDLSAPPPTGSAPRLPSELMDRGRAVGTARALLGGLSR